LLRAHSIDFFLESIWETSVKSGSSGHNDVGVEIFSNIQIAFLDRLESQLMHTQSFISLLNKAWVEKSLWTHESWSVDRDSLTVWEFVLLGNFRRLSSLGFISGWVK
jgi:hypothetical protein